MFTRHRLVVAAKYGPPATYFRPTNHRGLSRDTVHSHVDPFNPRFRINYAPEVISEDQDEFNRSYCSRLRLLEQASNGAPQTLGPTIGSMYTLKSQAQALMEMPTEDRLETAGRLLNMFPSIVGL